MNFKIKPGISKKAVIRLLKYDNGLYATERNGKDMINSFTMNREEAYCFYRAVLNMEKGITINFEVIEKSEV